SPFGARRLWNRLLLLELPAALPSRLGQDRSLLRLEHLRQPEESGDRADRPELVRDPGDAGDRRRDRDGAAAAAAARSRLPPGSGIPVLTPGRGAPGRAPAPGRD